MRPLGSTYLAYTISLAFGLLVGRWTLKEETCTPSVTFDASKNKASIHSDAPAKPTTKIAIATKKPVHPCDKPDKGGCQHNCVKDGNGFKCTCSEGFTLSNDAKTCTRYEKLWRDDEHCGPNFKLANGQPGQCNPQKNPCCSNNGWCGDSPAHCKCQACVDYSSGKGKGASSSSKSSQGTVSCGGHRAADCSSCTMGHGADWCNGDCEWCKGSCVLADQCINNEHNDPSHWYHNKYAQVTLNEKLATDPKFFSSKVTVVTFCKDKKSIDAVDRLLTWYPDVKVLVGSPRGTQQITNAKFTHLTDFGNKAEALNMLISQVATDYFLHLDTYHNVDSPKTHQSVGWLLQSLEQIKTLDLIGGSVLVGSAHRGKNDILEIPCYRLHHYNYTFSETYEYKESVIDIMLCERTSSSFLINTTTFKHKGLKFDEGMGDYMFEDFFLQTKQKGVVVSTRQEVFFHVSTEHNKQPSAIQHVTTKFKDHQDGSLPPGLISFGRKHQVMTIIDNHEQVLQICADFNTVKNIGVKEEQKLLCGYDEAHAHWKFQHWTTAGLFTPPTIMTALKQNLKVVGDFFDSKGWLWVLRWGGALGAVKNRGFLPWSVGNIHIHVKMSKNDCLKLLQNEFLNNHPEYDILDLTSNQITIEPKHGSGGILTITVGQDINDVVRMRMDGYWVQCSLHVVKELKAAYGTYYLQQKKPDGKHIKCIQKSNACLPNYSNLKDGRAGIWSNFFVENKD